jgi:hypothetical protein
MGDAMHAIYDLDRSKPDPIPQYNLNNISQHILEYFLSAPLYQSLPKDGQGVMIWRTLIRSQSYEVLCWQVLVDIHFYLALGQIVEIGNQLHLQYHSWIKRWSSNHPTPFI